MSNVPGGEAAVTEALAAHALSYRTAALPEASLRVAKECILDWFGVTVQGLSEPGSAILLEELGEFSSGPCTVVGSGRGLGPVEAALANGTLSHALDYDDVYKGIGHGTVAVLPAVLAVGELERARGDDALRAFIAGYEAAAVVGRLTTPSHYARGYHSTGTLGAIGAAVAAGLLHNLNQAQLQMAISLAATQSGGLKAMFGSMAKPLHAGKAAANGVLAARLAKRGFTASLVGLEDDQGFIATMSDQPRPTGAVWLPEPGSEIVNTLFKFHAACYLTHSSIDALILLKERGGLKASDVAGVELHVHPGHLSVCNIEEPTSDLECKFSLRHVAALVLAEEDTAAIETYSDASARRADLAALRSLVRVAGDFDDRTGAQVVVRLQNGQVLDLTHDTGIVEPDAERQALRVRDKFRSLAEPILGGAQTRELELAVGAFDRAASVGDLLALTRPAERRATRALA